jgi:hypothetical protein
MRAKRLLLVLLMAAGPLGWAGSLEAQEKPRYGGELIFAVPFDGTNTRTWGGTTFLANAAVGGDKESPSLGIDARTHAIPPATDRLHGELGGVVIDAHTDPAGVGRLEHVDVPDSGLYLPVAVFVARYLGLAFAAAPERLARVPSPTDCRSGKWPSQRIFLDNFANKHVITEPKDWGKVTIYQLDNSNGTSLLNIYKNTIFKMLKEVYPG